MYLRRESHAVVKHTEFSYNSAHSSLVQSLCRCTAFGQLSAWTFPPTCNSTASACRGLCSGQVECEDVVVGETQAEVGKGGAIYVDESSSIDVESSLFRSNCARYGGAVYIAEGGVATFVATIFDRNGPTTLDGRCDNNVVGGSVDSYIAYQRPNA